MQTALDTAGCATPQTLKAAQEAIQRAPRSRYSPAQAAHIAQVDGYIWLRITTNPDNGQTPNGGYYSPYPNATDDELENTRTITDKAQSAASLNRQIDALARESMEIARQITQEGDTTERAALQYQMDRLTEHAARLVMHYACAVKMEAANPQAVTTHTASPITRTAYAVTDDLDNPTHQIAALHREIAQLRYRRAAQLGRFITYKAAHGETPTTQARRQEIIQLVKTRRTLQTELAELTALLTPPTDRDGEYIIDPAQWTEKIARESAEYGLMPTRPTHPTTPTVDIFNTQAQTREQIAHLRELELEMEDTIRWAGMVQAEGLQLNRVETQIVDEAQDLLNTVDDSIKHHTARLHA
jgi:hypothetical protein